MYEVLRRVKSRDAALLFGWMKRRSSGKTLRDVGFESIAKGMNRSGLKTSRESAFTARVVRERIAELEDAGLIERDVCGEEFDVYLRDATGNVTRKKAASRLVSDDENGNEYGYENGYESGNENRPYAHTRSKEIIFKINKQINNPAGTRVLEEPEALKSSLSASRGARRL